MTDVRIAAHRGLHAEHAGGARENTLDAIRSALNAGVEWIEIDVRLTRDGEVVLLHDATLKRLWGAPQAVADVDLTYLRAMGAAGGRIPLLSEVLQAMHGSGATLLIDMDDAAPAAAAADVVRSRSSDVRIAWCGALAAMQVVRAELPDAAIWLPWDRAEPPAADDLVALRPSVINSHHLYIGASFVEAVHALGLEVSVWTVDDGAQAVHLASIGVDSITSNDPVAVRAAIAGGAPDESARRLAIVSELAEHAAEITARARQRGVGEVLTKAGPADHVTEIDRAIERHVRAALRAQFPEHDIVGEEYGGSTDGARPCWYLDPIDGTANLANGIPWTSFSLALVENGRPVVAAVLDPVGNADDGVSGPVPVTAAEGGGAWRAGVRLRTSPRLCEDALSGAIVTTELAGAIAWPGMHRLMDALGARHCTVRVPGSGTASLSGVALGRGAAALVHHYSPMDHAAALLVVAEAGGAVVDQHGAPTLGPETGPVFTGVDERAVAALHEEWRLATAAQ